MLNFSKGKAMPLETLISDLSHTYSPQRLLTQSAQLKAFESDGLVAFKSRPGLVVIPETQQEVIETVKACFKHDVPFLARGSGTSLSGGSMPIEGGVVIALNRLNKVLKFEPQTRMCVVEPGVLNAQVSKVASPYGLYYAPDPSSGPVCTIGGNVAFNSGGAHCLKYGMTSNHVRDVCRFGRSFGNCPRDHPALTTQSLNL
jgi:glycolate oxidase